jgi:hypothetical protein
VSGDKRKETNYPLCACVCARSIDRSHRGCKQRKDRDLLKDHMHTQHAYAHVLRRTCVYSRGHQRFLVTVFVGVCGFEVRPVSCLGGWKRRKVYSMQLAMNEVDRLIMKLCAFAVRRSTQRRWRSSRAKTQCTSNHAHRPSLQPEHCVRASARTHT